MRTRISSRTRAVMTGASSTPSRWGTVAAVLDLTSAAVDGDLIEVRRDENAPRYVPEFERPSVRLNGRSGALVPKLGGKAGAACSLSRSSRSFQVAITIECQHRVSAPRGRDLDRGAT